MLRLLFVQPKGPLSPDGTLLSLEPGAVSAQPFATIEERRRLITEGDWDLVLILSTETAQDPLSRLRHELPSLLQHCCLATHAAYLFGLPQPAAHDLRSFAEGLVSVLASLPDDLLAQCAGLVQEEGATSSLGLFAAELERRFDILNAPPAGEVDITQFAPAESQVTRGGRHDVSPDLLADLFTARQDLASAFESYEERPQQQAMVKAVQQALDSQQTLVVEAGTGVGKSLGYLLPLAIHAVRNAKLCIVSTNTLNLQQQLLMNDIPKLRSILKALDLSVALLKGREHYLCLKRLQDVWLVNSSTARQRRQQTLQGNLSGLLFMLRSLLAHSMSDGGDLDDVPAAPGQSQAERNRLANTIDCGFHTCLGDRCEHKPRCHFFKRREAALNSHIVLSNHALVFSLFRPEAEDSDTIVSRSQVIVFDEAHNLEGAITSQRTLALSHEQPVELGNELQRLIEDRTLRERLRLNPESIDESRREQFSALQSKLGKLTRWVLHGAEVAGQVRRLLEQAAEKGRISSGQSSQLSPATADRGQLQVLELLEKLGQRLRGTLQHYHEIVALLNSLFAAEESPLYLNDPPLLMELQSLGMRLGACLDALNGWQPAQPESICWFNADLSQGEARWSYFSAPLNIGPVFQALKDSQESLILCSATLSVAGSFDYFKQSLGFAEPAPDTAERTAWLRLDSPFDYGRQSLLLVATDLDGPTGNARERYLQQLSDAVSTVSRIFDKGVLVLFNSYRDLNHVGARLEDELGERLLLQGLSGSRAELAERFRRAGNLVLFATRSFWEGFDVAGDALSCVVLAKLPFANFKDPIHAGRQRAMEALGRNSFSEYSLPQAAMQLQQGFGRLIRSGSDRGCVFLLDSRVARASYGRIFLDSLPRPRTFSGSYQACLQEAQRFMSLETPGDAQS